MYCTSKTHSYIFEVELNVNVQFVSLFLQVCYFFMLLSAGLPIFFLEVILGQYSGEGPIKTFEKLVPILSGLGYVRN